ncbi:Piwi-domain-containing protein [Corynespora cassiicola Philippines]|uniref:Piwi-domain-containing protein n=1 Tax=Corynespora cassiicola Philippines TaxID=1448308 RepID=A0A2T2NKR2_CORCC|nr:Piwi-domain-containing protein [Corynespora cassiicola Philippines]
MVSSVPQSWLASDHEFYYPAVTHGPTNTPPNPKDGHTWPMDKVKKTRDAVRELVKHKNTMKFSARTTLPEISSNPVWTNHFEFAIDKQLYEYEILELENKDRSRRMVKILFKEAIQSWDFLRDNQDSFAHDGYKTIVSWKKLHIGLPDDKRDAPGVDIWGYAIPYGQGRDGRTRKEANARFKFVRKVDVETLKSQTKSDPKAEPWDKASSVIKCLNTLISMSLDERVHQASPNKFFVKSARSDLNNATHGTSMSLETIRGYFYTLKPGMHTLLLNFNVATSAFFKPILVSEFMADTATFGDEIQRRTILKRLKVFIEYDRADKNLNGMNKRVKIISEVGDKTIGELEPFRKKAKGADGKPIPVLDDSGKPKMVDDKPEYKLDDNTTSVKDHLEEVFGMKIAPDSRAINVGDKTHPVWYAEQHLRIVPYQLYKRPVPDHLTGSMVNIAAHDPDHSRNLIEKEGLEYLGFRQNRDEKISFAGGAPISLFPTMFRVDCTKLPFPQVNYRTDISKDPMKPQTKPSSPGRGSGWNLAANDLFHAWGSLKKLDCAVICDMRVRPNQYESLGKAFANGVKRCGIQAVHPKSHPSELNPGDVDRELQNASLSKPDLVILMLKSFNRKAYSDFKNLADRKFGVQSVCITYEKGNSPSNSAKYMTNVAMKVNLKFGGINSYVTEVDQNLDKAMLLGADVVHPSSTAGKGCPSIAAIVGSMDDRGQVYQGAMRLNPRSLDVTDREIIDRDLVKEMVMEMLKKWKDLPKSIIYYRDGVSEGQFEKVRDIEAAGIKDAFDAVIKMKGRMVMKPSFHIAVVVGRKRHHTRFYPINEKDKDKFGNQNCSPGTCVDRLVTSPYYNDFYLQSHSGIKGTARPTHYFVVKNTIPHFSVDKLRNLTHALCYSYCRSTTAVSYAAPTYYADRLCERGRLYLPKCYGGDDWPEDRDSPEKMMEHAKEEFYEYKPQGEKRGNPWGEELGKRMFWM